MLLPAEGAPPQSKPPRAATAATAAATSRSLSAPAAPGGSDGKAAANIFLKGAKSPGSSFGKSLVSTAAATAAPSPPSPPRSHRPRGLRTERFLLAIARHSVLVALALIGVSILVSNRIARGA